MLERPNNLSIPYTLFGPAVLSFIRGRGVLLVEDDPDALELLAIFLRNRHAVVRIAKDGRSALLALEAELVDVVVSDIGLPNMNGLELRREVTRRLGRAGPRSIAMTASVSPADRALALEVGFDDYIGKPLNLDDVVLKILALVGPRQGRKP